MNEPKPAPRIDEAVYERYLTALLSRERAECAKIVQDLAASGASLKDLYVDLFQRSMYAVGVLWENQKISVATEHLATAITERMLTLVHTQAFSGPPRDKSIVIACVADEYHQLGGRMIADFCELRGWRGYFLGTNTSVADLLKSIEERRPALVGLSLSLYANQPALLKALDAVTAAHPDLPILLGGQAFRWGALSAAQNYRNVTNVTSLDELEQRMAAYEH